MTWLDSMVGWLDPERGYRRVTARRELALVSSYEGAGKGRNFEGWTTRPADANEDLRWDLDTLRARARDLVRNTPHAANAVRQLATQLVGTGITPLIGGARKQQVEDAWRWFCDDADFDGDTDYYGLQALAAQTMVESGEALILFRPAPSTLNLKVPLQLQVLEPDYIDSAKNSKDLPGGGYIVSGVEFDAAGRRVAFWLFSRHPGSVGRKLVSSRVPAGDVIHLFRKDRPGASRAAPWLAPVIVKARDLADYDRAELLAKKLQACTSEFITTSESKNRFGKTENDVVTGEPVEKMKVGQRIYLRPGESVTQSAPPIVPGYGDYSRKNLRDFAAGVGIMYEALTGDLSTVNYSSFRAGHVFFTATYNRYQWHTVIPNACARPWARFQDVAEAVGLIDGPPETLGWMPPARESIDPLKDFKATLVAVRAGFMSLRQAIGEQGYDAETVLRDIEEMNAALDEKNLTLDSDPRKTAAAGSLQPAGDNSNGASDGNNADGPDQPAP